ncbi:hypothetical protein ACFGVR_07845 [Mucilaginibacter sp. AW1-3]
MKKAFLTILLPGIILLCLCAARIDGRMHGLTGGLIDSLQHRMAVYQAERPFNNLYVHLDKNNYLTNESIWFKAYMLTNPGLENKVLFVRLTDADKKVILSYQFPVYDIRAHGDMLLPDTLKQGEYFFYAFTNTMLNFAPNQVFVQKIKIFKNAAENMEAEAGVTDSTKLRRGAAVDILIKLKKGNRYVTDVKGNYQLLVDDKPIKAGKVTTNFLGEAFISFTYPQIADNQTLKVTAKFNKDNDGAELNLNLRHEASPVVVNVWPEGGHLVEGIVNHVAIEAGDNKNNPLTTALLFKNGDEVLARLQTNAYGIAKLDFVPRATGNYHFEVPGNTNKTPIVMNAKIEPAGLGLWVKQTGNRFYATVYNKGKSDSATLVLRSYTNVLWHQGLVVKTGDSTRVELPAADFPKGVLSLALFDNAGNCAAERLLMNKQTEQVSIGVQTDKPSYGLRQRVKVTINARDLANMPMVTNLSVAVVEKTRINSGSYTTILDNYYYKALSQSFADQHYNSANAADMDAVLIGKKWYANNWTDLLAYKPRGYRRMLKNTDGVSGMITSLKHKPIQLKSLIVMSKGGFSEVPVDKDGYFYIPSDDLITERSDKRYIMLNPDFYDKYDIKITNFEGEYDNMAVFSGAFRFPDLYNSIVKLNDKTGVNLKGNIQLREVKIKDNTRNTELSVDMSSFTSKTCNDYVCMYSILNCPNHKFGNPPVDGGIYIYNGRPVVYHGCASQMPSPTRFLLKNIATPNKFILPDYDKDPSNEPELRSTIYWESNLNTGTDGKVTFEFFTSDIKGDFTIMVQGIDVKTLRPVYGTGGFVVR